MGKDIHLLTEIKKDNKWQYIEEYPESYEIRNYCFFGILENFEMMGIPEELKGKKFRYNKQEDWWEFDFTSDDLFHHSYVTLTQLKNYIKNANKLIVSEEFVEIFFELGGVLPKGMTFDSEEKGIFVEIQDEYEYGTQEIIKDGIKELEDIAKKYNVSDDNIRLVYAFDW